MQLTGTTPLMLFGASLFELLTSNYFDMTILLGAQFINASISYYETQKAWKAEVFFKSSLRPIATVKRDGLWQNIDSCILVPGDLVMLAAGSTVPADCYVNEVTHMPFSGRYPPCICLA